MTARWSPDFLDLLTALNAADARYMLVGGHAVGIFGRPRATKDFDLWIEASPDNAARVMHALRDFGAPLGDVTESDFAVGGSGFRMGTPPFRIELLTEISGVAFADAWPSRESPRSGWHSLLRHLARRSHHQQTRRRQTSGHRGRGHSRAAASTECEA